MRTVIGLSLVLACAIAAPGWVSAEKKDKPKQGKGKPQVEGGAAASADGGGPTVSVSVAFTTGQRDSVHGWYVESYGRGTCPPGLAKKHNGCLPPGQAKKRYVVGQPLAPGVTYKPIPSELSVRIGKPPEGYLYVTLDGDLLKLAVGTLLVARGC